MVKPSGASVEPTSVERNSFELTTDLGRDEEEIVAPCAELAIELAGWSAAARDVRAVAGAGPDGQYTRSFVGSIELKGECLQWTCQVKIYSPHTTKFTAEITELRPG
ncbi:hypothetical protein J7E29_00010 [Streptomyces sp. ISL-90]|nr:hypothetical protein [Streptomyces sp. ISL-90]